MYRVTYESGNGYRCNCCRRTSIQTFDCNTAEEVQEWVNELYASYKFPEYEDDDDRSIESIEKEIGVNIQDQFMAQQEVVDQIVAKRKKKKDDEKIAVKKADEDREYKKYLKLKEKFENQ